MQKLILNGQSLTLKNLKDITTRRNVRVEVASSAMAKVKKSFQFLQREISNNIVYGVNTGFGPMASHIVSPKNLAPLQKNLIRSHAVGMGNPIPEAYVLAAMVVRLNTLARGFSGVSLKLINQLTLFINHRIIPVVPDHGAVGTSGDLVQLAHIALALIGEGDVFYKGTRRSTTAVLKKLSIKSHVLEPKEGLGLINGTAVMSGIGALLAEDADRLLGLSTRLGALALEAVGAFSDGLSEHLHGLRPHKGQMVVARALRSILKSSKRLHDRSSFQKTPKICDDVTRIYEEVQEVYSIRCIPQIVGPVFDIVLNTARDLAVEINSVTDNPVVDWQNKTFLHGGNFHGDYIAAAVDQMKIGLVKLTMLSERRINFFLNSNANKRFPPFLNLKKPGLTLGLQGLQFVATSTTARSQTLAFPQYVHSIPTNADNQDVVSMGTDAALIAAQVVDHAYIVFSIELITLAQAVDVLNIQREISHESFKLYSAVRKTFPAIYDDRVLVYQLDQLVNAVKHDLDIQVAWET